MKKSQILYGGIFLLIISLGVFVFFGMKLLKGNNLNGEIVNREAPDFTLTDQKGQSYSLSDDKGDKVLLVYFGYTHCPDVCPTTLATLTKVIEKIGDKSSEIQILFISVDPERDTVEKLNKYVSYFRSNIKGLTGSPEAIKEIAEKYRIFYFKEDVKSDSEYVMSHSPSVYLINKSGKLYLKYPQNSINASMIAEDLRRLI